MLKCTVYRAFEVALCISHKPQHAPGRLELGLVLNLALKTQTVQLVQLTRCKELLTSSKPEQYAPHLGSKGSVGEDLSEVEQTRQEGEEAAVVVVQGGEQLLHFHLKWRGRN